MLRFLYFGDMHGGVKAPKHRSDNFLLTRQEKIKEILQIAKDNKVTALLQAGDFLSKANIAPEYLTREILNWTSVNINDLVFDIMVGEKTIKDLENALTEVTPMISTIGNHELIGGELDSFPKTSLNMLVESGFMTLATKDKPIVFKDEEGFSVAISATPYTHDIDGDDKSAYIVDKKSGDFHIHMVHGMLMEKSYGKKFKHTVVQEIAYETKADLTINGHDHIGYDEIELDGKKFINPGSPVRLSAEKKEMDRMPKVLLITIDKVNGIQLEPIYLKCAKKGNEVLSRDHIEAKEVKSEKIEEVKSLMNKAKLKKGFDITEIISNLGNTKGIEKTIIEEVVADIVASMDKLMTPFNPKGSYYITRLELENFQSHKDSVFEFTNGLNILAGSSRNGKSAVLRAIRELFECYMKNPREAIFFGEDHFKITAYLSNGYIISRIVEKKKSGKNGFEIYDPTTGASSYYNTKGLELVQEILGFNKIKLTEKNKINVNFSVQGDSWFMLGNNMSAPDRAKLIGVMYGTHYADAVLKDINGQAKKIVAEINIYEKDIDNLKKEADTYLYLEPLKECLDEAELLYQEAFELEEVINKTTNLLEERKNIQKEIDELNSLIKVIEKNEKEYKRLLQEIKEDSEKILKIEQGIKDINAIVKDGKQARYVLNSLNSLEDAKNIFKEIKNLKEEIVTDNDNLEKAKVLEKDLLSIKKELDTLNEINSNLKEISEVSNLLNEIKSLDNEITLMTEKIKKANDIVKEQSSLKQEINANKEVLKELSNLDNVTSLLDEIKVLKEETNNIDILVKELKDLEKEINLAKEEEDKYKEQTLVYLDEYKAELESMGKCPVCHGKITKAVINTLLKDLSKNLK